MNYPETLKQLCSIPAPSGFETPAAQAALELLRPLVDEAWIDKMGSVVGVRRCGKEGARKLLLDAHLDEIGFIVTGHQDGFLRFAPLGGVDPRMLPDRELTILTDPPTYGVVACLPPHIQSREDMDRALPIQDLYLDTGLSQEEAQRRIPVGTPAVYRTGCRTLGDKLLCGKALDDRSCFAILLHTLQLLQTPLPFDLYVLGSVQEESTMAGAKTGVFSIAPSLMVAVDVTFGASPDTPKQEAFCLGGGPAIGVGPMLRRDWSDLLIACAEQRNLPFHVEVLERGLGTNAMAAAVTREGIPAAMVSLPLRSMHTPQEVVDLRDAAWSAQLLVAFLRSVREEALG